MYVKTLFNKLVCKVKGHNEVPMQYSYHMKKGMSWVHHIHDVDASCKRCRYNLDITKYQTINGEGTYGNLTLEWKD